MVPSTNFSIQLPAKWDDAEITKLLQRYRGQPAVLSHAISEIKGRMILNQDIKTAQKRLQLVASVIEVFKLNKELQSVLHDIHLAEKDFEIRKVEADIRLEDAQARLQSERRLRQLRSERDELILRKETTQLRSDIDAIDRPARTERQEQLTPEQQREKRHAASEARIQKLKNLKQEALKLQDEAERLQKVNALDDEIQREIDEWRKSL